MMSDDTAQQPSRILLVRHGQSVANAGGIPPDHITNPLTELGHAQAKAFADGFSCEPTLFLISPYTRAQQTSVPLRQRYPGVPIEEWPVYEFNYLEPERDRKSTRLNSSHVRISYAVFCLKKKR